RAAARGGRCRQVVPRRRLRRAGRRPRRVRPGPRRAPPRPRRGCPAPPGHAARAGRMNLRPYGPGAGAPLRCPGGRASRVGPRAGRRRATSRRRAACRAGPRGSPCPGARRRRRPGRPRPPRRRIARPPFQRPGRSRPGPQEPFGGAWLATLTRANAQRGDPAPDNREMPSTRLRSGARAGWTSAWLAGDAASDDVLRATVGGDAPHQVAGLSDGLAPLSEALITWRRRGGSVRLVLPVAGDVRGLPGPAQFRSCALDAGEVVIGGGLGLVPDIPDRPPRTAPPTVTWHAHVIDEPPPDPLAVAEAQRELTEAVRDAASALAAADVASWVDDVSDALADARRAGERLNLPPRFPAPAVRLVAQAERLQAVLDIAALDPTGGAIDRTRIGAPSGAPRSLATALPPPPVARSNAAARSRPPP